MKQKTPIQELIEKLDKEINSKYPDGYNIVMEIAKDLTEQMLEKEKEVMCEFAFNCGDEIKDQNKIKFNISFTKRW